jgi:hypothetical protein
MVPIAWPTGADIYLEKIDEKYFKSIQKIGSIFKEWYPKFPFSTKIYTKKLIRNTFKNNGYALLFTGGVDSLSSYIRNKKKKTILISFHGNYFPIPNDENLKKIGSWLSNFANMDGLNFHIVKTNFSEAIKRQPLEIEYGDLGHKWWLIAAHSVIMLGSCAPLTIMNKIGTILIASSYTEDFNRCARGGWDPLIDNNIKWSGTKVVHDSYELSRHEKIKSILKNNPKYHRYLRVCVNSQYQKHNCGNCEKCLRTITSLLLEDQDPKEYNFNIEGDIIERIKNRLARIYGLERSQNLFFWRDIQKYIPQHIKENKIYNSKEFFKSFKKINLSDPKYSTDNQKKSLLFGLVKQYYFLARYFGAFCSLKLFFQYLLFIIKARSRASQLKICFKCKTLNQINSKCCLNCNHEFLI